MDFLFFAYLSFVTISEFSPVKLAFLFHLSASNAAYAANASSNVTDAFGVNGATLVINANSARLRW